MALTLYCPFLTVDYRDKYGKLRISCERAVIDFASYAEYKEYMCKYCGSLTGWKGCSIAESTLNHYERLDNEGKN